MCEMGHSIRRSGLGGMVLTLPRFNQPFPYRTVRPNPLSAVVPPPTRVIRAKIAGGEGGVGVSRIDTLLHVQSFSPVFVTTGERPTGAGQCKPKFHIALARFVTVNAWVTFRTDTVVRQWSGTLPAPVV